MLEVLISVRYVDGSNWCELSVACFDFEGDVRMVFYENLFLSVPFGSCFG